MTYVESKHVTLTEETEHYSFEIVRTWIASLCDVPLFPWSKGSVTMSRSADTAEAAVSALKAAVEEQGWEWRNH